MARIVAFFNNKGGVGKTSLVYHLAWMFADQGIPALAVDLDPQANLTSMFLREEQLEALWERQDNPATIWNCVQPLVKIISDIREPHVETIADRLGLIPGNMALSRFEDALSEQWTKCLNGEEGAFRIITAFYRVILKALATFPARVVLIDIGPNLGAINRSALIAADQVVVPLAPDLFSLQGLRNLAPTLREWRKGWENRTQQLREHSPESTLALPKGTLATAGYIVMQHRTKESRPVKAYQRWMNRIPEVYHHEILQKTDLNSPSIEDDSNCLARLKHYNSLMPLAMEAHQPMFFLKPSDGAIGAHVAAVSDCYKDFSALAKKIAETVNLQDVSGS